MNKRIKTLHVSILVKVLAYGPLSLTDLVDDTGLEKNTIIYLCNSLRKAGLLRRMRGLSRESGVRLWASTQKLEEAYD